MRDFCYKFKDELQRDFDEQNDFQTSIRGVKIKVFTTQRMKLKLERRNYQH